MTTREDNFSRLNQFNLDYWTSRQTPQRLLSLQTEWQSICKDYPDLTVLNRKAQGTRVTRVQDLRHGPHLRVFYQPLYKTSLIVDVCTVYGRPFLKDSKNSFSSKALKVNTGPKNTRSGKDFACTEYYVSDLGVRPRPHAPTVRSGACVFRFSSKLQTLLLDLQTKHPFISYCWYTDTRPTLNNFLLFILQVEEVEEEKRISSSMTSRKCASQRPR